MDCDGRHGIAAAEVGHAEGLYFIAFAILFFFLLIVSLRLPLIYPLIAAFVWWLSCWRLLSAVVAF